MDQTEARKRGDIIRTAYTALSQGDLPTLMSFIAEDVLIDRPALRMWGSEQRGREYFLRVIGRMIACVDIEIEGWRIFEGEQDVAATLAYTLISRRNGERISVEIVEIFTVLDGKITRIDVFDKEPAIVSTFLARAEAEQAPGAL